MKCTSLGRRQTTNESLHHVTKFSSYWSFTVNYINTKISSFITGLSIRILLHSFYLLIWAYLRNCQLESDVFVNVILNLSIDSLYCIPHIKNSL